MASISRIAVALGAQRRFQRVPAAARAPEAVHQEHRIRSRGGVVPAPARRRPAAPTAERRARRPPAEERRSVAGAREHDRKRTAASGRRPGSGRPDGTVGRCSCSCVTARPKPTRVGSCSDGPIRRSPSWADARPRRWRRASRPTPGSSPARCCGRRRPRPRSDARSSVDERWIELDYGDDRRHAGGRRPRRGVDGSGGPIRTSCRGRRVAGHARHPGAGRVRGPARRSPRPRRRRREPRVADQGRDRVGARRGRRGDVAHVRAGRVDRADRDRTVGSVAPLVQRVGLVT